MKMDTELFDRFMTAYCRKVEQLSGVSILEETSAEISRPLKLELVHNTPILPESGSVKPRRRRRKVVFRVIEGGLA